MKKLKCSVCRKNFKNYEKGVQVITQKVSFDSAVYYGEEVKPYAIYSIPIHSYSSVVKRYHTLCAPGKNK